MTPISDKAFAIMAVCPEAKKYYGITVDPISKKSFKFVWAFKIDKNKAHREGYDSQSAHGSIDYDKDFPGCPYCGTKQFVFCSCGAVVCWHGEKVVTCPNCHQSSEVEIAESFDLRGGGF